VAARAENDYILNCATPLGSMEGSVVADEPSPIHSAKGPPSPLRQSLLPTFGAMLAVTLVFRFHFGALPSPDALVGLALFCALTSWTFYALRRRLRPRERQP